MKNAISLRVWMALATAGVAAYALYASLYWPFRTALFPRVLGIPLLALSTMELILSLTTVERAREGHAVDFEMTADLDPHVARKRTVGIFSWILGFFILILVFGFTLAVPLFVFLYMKFAGNERWGLSLILAALAWLTMEGLFNRLLHIPFAEGWISYLWR
jgi:Tripartite tricarboxylate transporter TctB family